MAGVKFSRKEFEKHIKITDEVKEKISLMKTHFEGMNEEEIELEITPDRPDLYSLQGWLRQWNSFTGKTKGLKEYKINKPEKNFVVKIDKNLKDIRPYTACAIVKNLKFDDAKIKEIIDIQEKLHNTLGRNRKKIAIGIYPLEKITLPIKFEARKPRDIKFVPLEMAKELDGLQILQQHATGREYAHLLEGMEKFPVFVDAKGKILSMPPIINSHETGKISEETKDIFIECSGFDFAILKKTLNILTSMLADMNGEIYSMTLDYGKKEITPDFAPEKMKLNLENVNKMLGLELNDADVKKFLEKMGYNYKNKEVEIPAYRTDVMHEVDIIEDIAIAYGYNNIIPEIPSIATIGEIDKEEVIKRKIAEVLAGLGFLELSSYHLLTKEDLDKYNEKSIEVEKSKSDYKYLKPDLSVSLLKILSENIDSEYPQKIFELGTCFELDNKEEAGIKEKKKLAIALTPGNFTEMKQILDYVMRMLSLNFSVEEGKDKKFIEGRAAKIILDNKEIGIFGEVHPSILKTWRLKMPLVLLELDLEEVFRKV